MGDFNVTNATTSEVSTVQVYVRHTELEKQPDFYMDNACTIGVAAGDAVRFHWNPVRGFSTTRCYSSARWWHRPPCSSWSVSCHTRG